MINASKAFQQSKMNLINIKNNELKIIDQRISNISTEGFFEFSHNLPLVLQKDEFTDDIIATLTENGYDVEIIGDNEILHISWETANDNC